MRSKALGALIAGSLPFLPFNPCLSQDLRQQFSAKENCSWDNAQFQVSEDSRIYLDKSGNVFFIKANWQNCEKHAEVGKVVTVADEQNNICYRNGNGVSWCRSVFYRRQAEIEDGKLIIYYQTIDNGSAMTPSRETLKPRAGFKIRRGKAGKIQITGSATTPKEEDTRSSATPENTKQSSHGLTTGSSRTNNSQLIKENPIGNSCPGNYAYVAEGRCRKVECRRDVTRNDPTLGGKNWKCERILWALPSLTWGQQESKTTYNPSCPAQPPDPGWKSSCWQRDGNKDRQLITVETEPYERQY